MCGRGEAAMTIRKVELSDADALGRILVGANNATFRGIVPEVCLEFTEAQSAANWKRSLSVQLDDDDLFFVAEEVGDSVIGYVWRGDAHDPTFAGELKQIMVHPVHQCRGIGRFML